MKLSKGMELSKDGWKFEPFFGSKIVGEYEIGVETCIGDFCVGVYDADTKFIIGEKTSFKKEEDAWEHAFSLVKEYEKKTKEKEA